MIGFKLVSKETMVRRTRGIACNTKTYIGIDEITTVFEKGYKANFTSAGLRQRRTNMFKLPSLLRTKEQRQI